MNVHDTLEYALFTRPYWRPYVIVRDVNEFTFLRINYHATQTYDAAGTNGHFCVKYAVVLNSFTLS